MDPTASNISFERLLQSNGMLPAHTHAPQTPEIVLTQEDRSNTGQQDFSLPQLHAKGKI
jgi:hypothetical protein